MATAMIESRPVGRPKKDIGTVSVRIGENAQQLARKACGHFNESLVEYLTRIVCERAQEDLEEVFEEYKEAKKKAHPKGGR